MGHHHSHEALKPPTDWDTAELKNWTTLASKHQKNFYLAFNGRQFDEYKPQEYNLISVKICYALFGPPREFNPNAKLIKIEITDLYSNEQKEKAYILKKKIVEVHRNSPLACCSNLCMSTIFVMCKQGKDEFQIPVFRVRVNTDETIDQSKYVDASGRIYSSWDDWKDSNVLPAMKYCYPDAGYYSSENGKYNFDPIKNPIVAYDESPSSSQSSKILQGTDIGLGAIGLVAAGVEIAAFFIPVVGPVLAVAGAAGIAAALYGAGRAVERLADKSSHGESITDVESILDILSVVAIPLNFASSAANAGLLLGARTGRSFTHIVRIGVTVLKLSTVTLDSSMLVLGLVNLIQKGIENRLSPLDILQFSVSTFFFSHTIIQPKTAQRIIEKGQMYHFSQYQKGLSDEAAHRAFQEILNEHNANIAERSKLIKIINKIEDPDSFFKQAGEEGAHIQLIPNEENMVKINYQIEVNPNRVLQLGPDKSKELFRVTKRFRNGEMSNEEYGKFMTIIGREERLGFEARRMETFEKIAKALDTDTLGLRSLRVNNVKLFKNPTGSQMDRLRVIFADTAQNYNKDFINTGLLIAEDFKITDLEEFSSVMEMLSVEGRGKTRGERKKLISDLKNNTNNCRADFVKAIKQDAAKANRILEKSQFKFDRDITAAYHYRKHHMEFGNEITMNVYFNDIPNELFKEEHLFKEVYSQDGLSTIRTYADANGFKFGVLIETSDGSQRMATLFQNEKFFENWTDRLAAAKEYIKFVRDLHRNARSYKYSTLLREYILKDIGYITNFRVKGRNGTNTFNDINANQPDYNGVQDVSEVLVALQ